MKVVRIILWVITRLYFDWFYGIFVDKIKQEEVECKEKSTVTNVVTNAAVEERKPSVTNRNRKSDGNKTPKKSDSGAKIKKTKIKKSFLEKADSSPSALDKRDIKYNQKLQSITKKEKADSSKRNKKLKQRTKKMGKVGKKRKLEETLDRDDASEW